LNNFWILNLCLLFYFLVSYFWVPLHFVIRFELSQINIFVLVQTSEKISRKKKMNFNSNNIAWLIFAKLLDQTRKNCFKK